MDIDIVSAIIAFGSLIVSSVAVYMSWKNAQQQGELAQRLNDQDQDFERKRFITALWDKMANVAEIQPNEKGEYDEEDIFDALNTLELVAICWQNKIIDTRMVYLVFGDSYSLRFQEIQGITQRLKKLRKTGPELLQERRQIKKVYEKIDQITNE